MPIRLPATTTPQEPQRPSAAAASPIAAPAPIGNSAAELAGVGSQAERLAASLYQEERDREVQTRVLELDVERRRSDAEIVDGYLQNLGKAAVENRGEVMAQLAQNSKRLRAGISDRAVANVFARQDAALMEAASRQIDAHYRRENLRWQDDTLTARADRLLNDLGRVSFGEGEDLARGRLSDEAERTRSALLSTIADRGQLLGWDAERVDVERRKADSVGYSRVLDRLIQEDRPDDAAAFLDAVGGAVDAQVADVARRGIEAARRGQRAHTLFQELRDSGGSLLEQVEALDGMDVPDSVRRDVASRLEHRAGLVSRQRAELVAESLSTAQRYAEEGAPLPPDVYRALEDTGQVWRYEEWRDARGRQWTTTEYGRKARWTTPPGELLQFSTSAQVWDHYRSEMNDDDLRGMVGEWRSVREAYGKQVDAAAERLLQPREDVIERPLSQSEALSYFRRLPDVDDALADARGHEAALGRFEKSLRDKANELRREGDKGTRTELLDKALELLKQERTTVGGEERTLSTLGDTELQDATFETVAGPIDANLLTEELRAAARSEIDRMNREAAARGERPIEVTADVEVAMAKRLVDEQNVLTRVEDTRRIARGKALLARYVAVMRDDPELTRAMKEDRQRTRYTQVWVPFLGNRQTSQTITETDDRPWTVRRREAVRQRLLPMVGQLGLTEEDLEEVAEAVLSSYEAVENYDRLMQESTR